MIGTIQEIPTIKGIVNTGVNIIGKLNTTNELKAIIDISAISRPNYDGDYTIIPSINEQVLQTKNKTMTDNLSIKEIPYFQTSNEYGDTIYIGKEIDYGN